ncbi:MAG: hypothetical protein RR970_00875 [Hafnia sp.]
MLNTLSLIITKQTSQVFACLENTNQTNAMDMKDIRRQRLREWFSNHSIPEKEKSYISQLINGKASFGEKAARRLEGAYGMPVNFLDSTDNSEDKPLPRQLDSRQEKLLELFDRLPESEKDQHIQALSDVVEGYDKLFKELLQNRNLDDIIKKIQKK